MVLSFCGLFAFPSTVPIFPCTLSLTTHWAILTTWIGTIQNASMQSRGCCRYICFAISFQPSSPAEHTNEEQGRSRESWEIYSFCTYRSLTPADSRLRCTHAMPNEVSQSITRVTRPVATVLPPADDISMASKDRDEKSTLANVESLSGFHRDRVKGAADHLHIVTRHHHLGVGIRSAFGPGQIGGFVYTEPSDEDSSP